MGCINWCKTGSTSSHSPIPVKCNWREKNFVKAINIKKEKYTIKTCLAMCYIYFYKICSKMNTAVVWTCPIMHERYIVVCA
ncbi:hypothetical protein GDO78_006987 [Eleutherodactylus coqui]|uniref:Uncharacterized protein n=1 Tax=Eleutherodactylus coqui TaxID=57060 RepID=A0A8J6KC48_ELECQ|nr:hypothetical protein GDO78_006987 [Eleutherodactylus coqui]